jgi:glucosylceramidase
MLAVVLILGACKQARLQTENPVYNQVESYITTFDQTYKLAKVDLASIAEQSKAVDIKINTAEKFQIMDGFGYSLTGGSAQHLLSLSNEQRQAILLELFGDDENSIGVSYLRISLGSSDLDEKAFSYNDVIEGTEDLTLSNFSLEEDEEDLIPVLKEILAINPKLKIMASPWSPPTWMKTNNSTIGGSLKAEYFNVYADYFVKYIKGMKAHGISIDAITVQNEPLHPGNNPSLYMTPEDQAKFIKENLGPTFEKEQLDVKIIIYDHNADRIDYPMTVLNDKEAYEYIDGTAFHLYGGEIDNLTDLHDSFPDKKLYFTEQWIGAPGEFRNNFPWHMKHLIIGASRNWCKTVLEWNLSSAPDLQPHTNGGCTECLGAITIDNGEIVRNPAYYIIGQAAKFVRPGSIRIFSSVSDQVENVAFLTPDDEVVLIILNEANLAKSINIEIDGSGFTSLVEPECGITYVFNK